MIVRVVTSLILMPIFIIFIPPIGFAVILTCTKSFLGSLACILLNYLRFLIGGQGLYLYRLMACIITQATIADTWDS